MSLSRALDAVGASWRASLLASTQYRGNFVLSTLFSALWTAWSVLPLIVVFDHVESIKGWSPAEATLVFTRVTRRTRFLLQGLVSLSPFSVVRTQYAPPLRMRHQCSRSASSCVPFSIAVVALSALWSPMLY